MIGVGIVGAGHFGAVHARALALLPNTRLVASCGTDPAGVGRFAAEHGGGGYTDWRRLLRDPAVEAVVVATPHHLHRDVVIEALGLGRHVLVEKPLAVSVEDCDAIMAATATSEAKVMVGHITRFFPEMIAARSILSNGDIGRPVAGQATFVKLWMEGNRRPWHLKAASGGGMLMTAGIHALDRLVTLMDGRVASVSAMAGALFHEQEADDVAMLSLRFEDGRMGQVASVGTGESATVSGLWLACEGGHLSIDERGLRLGRGGRWRPVDVSKDADAMLGALCRQWEAFLDAIERDAVPPVGVSYARGLVSVIAAARRSATERREITIAEIAE